MKITKFHIANRLLRSGKLARALYFYNEINSSDPILSRFVDFNIKIARNKFNRLGVDIVGETEGTINDVYLTIAKSQEFDFLFYINNYGEKINECYDFIQHYLDEGWRLGYDPNSNFSTAFYTNKYPDISISAINPFFHYIKFGRAEGRSPNSIEDNRETPDKFKLDIELISNSEFFDPKWYIDTYSDRIDFNIESPAYHYLTEGFMLGFDPSPLFSTLNYLGFYRDIQFAGLNPLVHYLRDGRREGRKAMPDVNSARLGLLRLTKPETGGVDSVLKFDLLPEVRSDLSDIKFVVHVHLYHLDMMNFIAMYLNNISYSFDLLLSVQINVDTKQISKYFESRLAYVNSVKVKEVINRGRDVAPWVVYFRDEVLSSDYFLHVHTKKSEHNKNHASWFRFAMHTLLGSKSIVCQIVDILDRNVDVGVVSPCYFWSLANQPNYGNNKPICDFLFEKITGTQAPDECPDYPAGSFFWAKSEVLKPLLNLGLELEDFDPEEGQVDETIAHGIERLIGLLPLISNKSVHKVAVDVAYDMTRYVFKGRERICNPIGLQFRKDRNLPKTYKQLKVAVFSCLAGSYEEIMPLISNTYGIDCFLYTDSTEIIPPKGFAVRQSDYINSESVRTARFVKTHPHILLHGYDYVVWIDSNIHFMGDVMEYVQMVDDAGADLGVIFHPARASLIEEASEIVDTLKSDPNLVRTQLSRYQGNKNILGQKLIETNFMISKVGSQKLRYMMSLWWSELNNYTHRDQLSLPYAIDKSDVNVINILPEGWSARDSEDFILFEHGVDERELMISDFLAQ